MNKSIQILLTAAVVIGGIVFLASQSFSEVELFANADEIVKNEAEWLQRKTIHVRGYAHKVPPKGTIVGQNIVREFEVEYGGKRVYVRHEGVVPDTFKEESETVVKGTLSKREDGTLLLTTVGGEGGIMAKCPSRYAGKK